MNSLVVNFNQDPPRLLYTTEDSLRLNECRDCSVIAATLCIAYHNPEIKYEDVHQRFAELGRRPRGRTPGYITDAAFISFGFTMEEWSVEAKTLRTLEPELPKAGAFLINVRGHHCAYLFGAIQDWSRGRLHRVRTVHRIVPV